MPEIGHSGVITLLHAVKVAGACVLDVTPLDAVFHQVSPQGDGPGKYSVAEIERSVPQLPFPRSGIMGGDANVRINNRLWMGFC